MNSKMNIDNELSKTEHQEAELTFNVEPETLDVVMSSDILTINGVRFLKEDFCIPLMVRFHQERTVWGKIRLIIKKLNRK